MELNDINEKIAFLKSLRWGRSTREWQSFMEKYHCDIVCEIGVRMGLNFERMIKHNPKLAVAVDCWLDDGTPSRNDSCNSQAELDEQYNYFQTLVADKPFVKIYRDYSYNTVREFPDEYFDFVFIDADHTYEGCKRDILDWYPKIKRGGVLCGHDYVHRRAPTSKGIITFGVIEAVDEWVVGNKIPNFFLLKPSTWGVIKE